MENYNELAQRFEEYGKGAISDYIICYGNVLKLLGDVKGKKVLDYGCGTGKFSRILKDAGADVLGVDIAEKELAIARQKFSDINFYSPEEVAPMRGQFDSAAMNFVITAIPDQQIILDIFKRVHALLKPGGRLVMTNSNYERSANRKFLTFAIGDVVAKTGGPVVVYLGADHALQIEDYYYSQADYTRMLNQCGFEVEKMEEPLAVDEEFEWKGKTYKWKDEIKSPPFLIVVVRTV